MIRKVDLEVIFDCFCRFSTIDNEFTIIKENRALKIGSSRVENGIPDLSFNIEF